MALALLKVTVAVPAGGVVPFAGAVAPSGYLLCDGSVVSRAAYPNLFAAIGTLHGAGDGSTTFAIPDTRGLFLRGAGTHGSALNGKTPAGVLATKQGDATAQNGLAASSSQAAHAHTLFGGGGSIFGMANGVSAIGATNPGSTYTGQINSVTPTVTTTLTGDAETRPANIGVNYIIKT